MKSAKFRACTFHSANSAPAFPAVQSIILPKEHVISRPRDQYWTANNVEQHVRIPLSRLGGTERSLPRVTIQVDTVDWTGIKRSYLENYEMRERLRRARYYKIPRDNTLLYFLLFHFTPHFASLAPHHAPRYFSLDILIITSIR